MEWLLYDRELRHERVKETQETMLLLLRSLATASVETSLPFFL